MEGGREVELVSKTLQVEHKLFYFDLKENPRGRYLKISEKTASNRSTIIVPFAGVTWFLDLFNYYVAARPGEGEDVFNKELQLDTKVFYFDVGDNRRGRFLKISEASATRNRSTIIVPAGSANGDGWVQFRDILAQINEDASQIFLHQTQPNSEPKHLPRLSDDVGAGFISGGMGHSASERTSIHTSQEMGGFEASKVFQVDQKFFFDLGSNTRGQFLKISEVAGTDRSSIILPLSGLRQFHEAIGHFLEIAGNLL